MMYDRPRIAAWLMKDGGTFFHINNCPLEVSLQPNGTTLTAHLKFSDGCRQLTLKARSHDVNIGANTDHCQLFNRVIRGNSLLSRCTPVMYGYHDATRCIAMEFIPGATLLETLKLDLRGGSLNEGPCDCLLGNAAAALAEFHRINPSSVGLPAATRSNDSFVKGFERMLLEPALAKPLRAVRDELLGTISKIASDMASRVGNRLVVSDTQPKNILVSAFDQICFIDLDFASGPPALNVAFFLAAFDRLQTRYFLPRAVSTIGHWKHLFLQHYLQHAEDAEVREEIAFFYLFALLATMKRHILKRKWLSTYLTQRYVRQIKAVLEQGTGYPGDGYARCFTARPQILKSAAPRSNHEALSPPRSASN